MLLSRRAFRSPTRSGTQLKAPRAQVRPSAALSTPGEVADRCAGAFALETAASRPDAAIPLLKAALLVALEEEAAAAAAAAADAAAGGAPAQPGGAAASGGAASGAANAGGGALSSSGAATWSLSRLDALADEARRLFLERHGSGGAGSQRMQEQQRPAPGPDAARLLTRAVSDGLALIRQALSAAEPQTAPAQAAAAEPRAGREEAPRPPAADWLARNPVAALECVNAVLFDRQGYAACNRWGDAADAQLAAVLEGGLGNCVALCLLYAGVCERLGLPLALRALRDEAGAYYCVAWPSEAGPLAAAGGRCVIDVYGKGALLTVEEVCELFAVQPEALLVPSSRRALLAALLSELQAAHWSAACGCAPSPAARLPLLPSTALRGLVTRLDGRRLERAIAAAGKRVALMPRCLRARMELGLLSYFAGSYDDAFLELGICLEELAAGRAATFQAGGGGGGGAGRGGAESERTLPPEVVVDAGLLLDKLRLELLVAAA
ncbi:hypothetical protein Rsub_04512 [Raphidocelis subcapitata]|uniref:Protein SirB1 N-terminal domain-containing protein n=1 Tax=Raphidocelis subcapitata TaxID=307507 RepID=A0A2V0P505_9CHLO|nr:hypothetical protein Rsub_04512 [Raphidocelis subcapitata]|eukprot:GBF92165.1 hypothetical protein Rsub_04512 [Raphidocelis subcapitata]